MMATSGIENVVRLWEPISDSSASSGAGGGGSGRVVPDLVRVSKENQHRMGVDPFEVMLMRMGFRLAGMGEEGGAQGGAGEEVRGEDPGGEEGVGVAEGEERGEGMEDEEGDVRWIENPANCRQS